MLACGECRKQVSERNRPGGVANEVKLELRRRMHDPIPEQGRYLSSVLGGHFRYYGVPTNSDRLSAFRYHVERLWWRSLKRRSQRSRMKWERMERFASWLPPPKICHPWPRERFDVTT